MQAGQLKRPITIVQPSTTADAAGQPASGPDTPVLATRASIAVATGKEIYALGAGFTEQVTHKVVIRFPPAVTIAQGMKVLYEARSFKVQVVSDPTEDRRMLTLMCLEESK